jgi:hypothetical protein
VSERSAWPVRVYRLGAEPTDDLSATTTVDQRLEMVEGLTLEAFALAGHRPLPRPRSEWPVVVRRLGE